MSLIKWNPSFSVGVNDIDGQHQQLVTMINQLDDAMRAGKGKAALGSIVNGLIGYTKSHFATEEKYFDQYAYPDAVTHRAEHVEFIQKVAAFKQGFDEGKTLLSIGVMDFLSSWLKQHILGTDKKYTAHFNSKGLK